MSYPVAFTAVFPDTPTQSFVTTRFGACEQGQIAANMFPERVVRMQQTHSAHVRRYDPIESETLPLVSKKGGDTEGGICIADTDAIWTTEQDTLLVVKTADCLPILFYHPVGVIGGIHAGKKGLEQRIVAAALSEVCGAFSESAFGPLPFWIYYGPAVCMSCYQIDRTINLHMDLKRHAAAQVRQALGQRPFVEVFSPFCTLCRHDLFFSYRGGDQTDRLFTGILRAS